MKQILILCFLFLYQGLNNPLQAQGQYSYKPVSHTPVLSVDTIILNNLRQDSLFSYLSEFEKGFIYSLNYVRKKPKLFLKEVIEPYLAVYPVFANYGLSLQKDLAALFPVGSLFIDRKLLSIARAHARDLGKHNLMSHNSSNGESTQQRFSKVGVDCGSECINMANYESPLEVLISLLIDFKVQDLGHRKSLLNNRMRSVGVGVASGTDGKIKYTVVDLGCLN